MSQRLDGVPQRKKCGEQGGQGANAAELPEFSLGGGPECEGSPPQRGWDTIQVDPKSMELGHTVGPVEESVCAVILEPLAGQGKGGCLS